MAFINDLNDRLSRLAIAYGRHAVKGYLTKHIVDLVGTEKQVTLQRALGKGPWDSREATYYAGELIDPANIHFHQGLANDAPDAFFPTDIAHPNAAYESDRLPAGFGDEDPPDRAIGIYKTLQVANYDGAGAQTGFGYSASPARHIIDLMLRAKRSIARVNWPKWIDWRDYCAELINWDDGALTPHHIFLTLSNGGTLANGTYWIRVATLKGADISSASKDRSTTDPTVTASIAVNAPNSQFTVEWTSQAERGATGYRVYIGTAEGAEDRYFEVAGGATNTLLISTLAGATMGVPPNVATGALLRQIPRFETHLFFVPPFDLATAFDRIAQVTCMDWQYANGKLVFLTPQIRGPVFTLNMAEIRDFRTYKTDRRQSFNQIIVNYRDLDSPYLEQADPPVTINRLSLQAKEGVRPFEINLGGGYRSQAERVGNCWARRLIDSNQMMEGIGSPKTYIVLPGDVVNITHDVPGWVDESFYIEEKEEEEDTKAGYPLKGRVYGAWYSDTDSEPLPSPLPAPNPSTFVAPPHVTSVTLTQINTPQPDQTIESSIRVAVQFAAYVNRQRGRVYLKKSTEIDALYKDVGTITPDPTTLQGAMDIRGLAKAIYNIKVVPESGLLSAGIAGATMYPITITGKAATLASNTDFWIWDLGFGRRNRISWELPPDYNEGVTFEVWATLTGATWLGDPLNIHPANELYSGGTPSNLLYHGRLNEFFLSQDSPFALQEDLWLRSVDSSGNKSLWTKSDWFYRFNSSEGVNIPAAPTLTVDIATSSAFEIAIHLGTLLQPGIVTATRVQIRQQGGSWPSSVNGTDRQLVLNGLQREVTIPWFNGGTVEVRALFDGSPGSDWSNTVVHTMKARFVTTTEPAFDLAGGALGVVEQIALPNTFIVPAGKTLSLSRLGRQDGSDNVFTLGAGAIGIGYYVALTADATSSVSSNLYGFVSNVTNLGPGIVKGFHASADAAGSSTGIIAAANFQIEGISTTDGASAALMVTNTGANDVASAVTILAGSRYIHGVGNVVSPVSYLSSAFEAWMSSGSHLSARAFRLRNNSGLELAYIHQDGSAAFQTSVTILGASSAPVLSIADQRAAGRTWNMYSGVFGAGELSFYDVTAGAARLAIDSSGNVGINTTSPGARLQINHTGTTNALDIRREGFLGSQIFTVGVLGDISGGASNFTQKLGHQVPALTVTSADGILPAAAFMNGNVGIGTASPDAKFQVVSLSCGLRIGYGGENYFDSDSQYFRTAAGVRVMTLTPGYILPGSGYAQNIGTPTSKFLSLHAAELWVETLVAQDTLATIGGRVLVGPTTTLIDDLFLEDVTIKVKHNSLVNGDRVYMESPSKVEFIAITSGPTIITGGYSYNVVRDLDGTGSNTWYAGSAVFNTGQAGSGFIDLYSLRGVRAGTEVGPTIVGNVRNSSIYNDWSSHWALGNLNGLYGYGATTFGVAFGKHAAGSSYVTIDATNGYRAFGGSPSTVRIHLANDGSGFLANSLISWDSAGALTIAGSAVVGGVTIGSGKMYVGAGLFADPATGFYVDSTGSFSLKDKLTWNGTTLAIDGTVTATAGAIGGFNIGSDYIRDAVNSFGLASTVTAGDDVRFWAGDTFANRTTAPFRLTEAGVLVASSANITGTITATGGAITGKLDMAGASSAIAIGTTPPTSTSAGTGIWIDRTGLYALDAGSLLFKIAADGGNSKFGIIQSAHDSIALESFGTATQTNGTTSLLANSFGGAQTLSFMLRADNSAPTQYAALWPSVGTLLGLTIGANATPQAMLDVRGTGWFNSTATNLIYLSDLTNVAHGMTDLVPTSVYAMIGKGDSSRGGLHIRGFEDAGTYNPVTIDGIFGSSDPTDTIAALRLRAMKKNGTTSGAIGNSETALHVINFSTVLMAILGDGKTGIGTNAPKSALHVVGLPVYANNAAAVVGGLTAGAFYRTGADPDPVCVVH